MSALNACISIGGNCAESAKLGVERTGFNSEFGVTFPRNPDGSELEVGRFVGLS